MNRRLAWFLGGVLLALVALGVLIPSVREGGLAVNISTMITVVVVAVVAGSLSGVATRRR
ncbi:hypothetical protein BBK82_30115 [Lentzea guizhouensis]|uniref:Uncharacterized protein n=1 Tax=Lentzea guizhouensis TaxID=1586287 RepID=A0A1B2HPM3_9PSEU|nr:hypothetical protein [Lentzea guizhouensis]ANZ39668.1 hypothetical protein BBK82_30115 [Lentzea guizhouensis]